MKKHGKKYVAASNQLVSGKSYSLAEAIKLVKQTSITNFESNVEVAIRLNIDTKKSDQQLRGSVVLPNGTGRLSKVLVLAQGEAAKQAQNAGADYVGGQELITKIATENWFAYDTIVATPDMMPALGKIGKILGPKGLMPNPKTGTVTLNVTKAVTDIKKGMIEYRNDSTGNIHATIGKVSFTDQKLIENLQYLVEVIIKNKPASVKGIFIKNISISSTMGPGIKIDQNSFDI